MSATEEKAPVEPTAASQNPEASETTATTSTPAPEPIGEPTADVKPTTEAPTEAPAEAPAEALAETLAEAPAEVPAPAKTETSTSSEPSWPELKDDHPLSKLLAELPQITKDADYNEVYGIELGPAKPFHTKLILQKFLRANSNDSGKAKEQLLATLKWRKEFQPLKAKEESFEKGRFAGLGYVIELESVPASTNKMDVATFNIYGAVKDNKAAFGDLDGYVYSHQLLRTEEPSFGNTFPISNHANYYCFTIMDIQSRSKPGTNFHQKLFYVLNSAIDTLSTGDED